MDYKLANPETDRDEIKRRLTDMISDDDITKYLDKEGHQKIIKYSDLKTYKNIDELLPKFNDYKIILIESEVNSGHWTVVLKYKIKDQPVIEYFNSYGMKMGSDLNFISYYMNKLLGQGKNDLDNLLDTGKDQYSIIYNKKRFQSSNPKINTCGRWCLLRIIMMKHYHMDLYEFINFIEQLKDKYDYEADIVCASLMV